MDVEIQSFEHSKQDLLVRFTQCDQAEHAIKILCEDMGIKQEQVSFMADNTDEIESTLSVKPAQNGHLLSSNIFVSCIFILAAFVTALYFVLFSSYSSVTSPLLVFCAMISPILVVSLIVFGLNKISFRKQRIPLYTLINPFKNGKFLVRIRLNNASTKHFIIPILKKFSGELI